MKITVSIQSSGTTKYKIIVTEAVTGKRVRVVKGLRDFREAQQFAQRIMAQGR